MTAQTKNLWAPLTKVHSGKDWINWSHIASTRRDSKSSFLAVFLPEHHKMVLRTVRFVRVTITEQGGQQ